jgi:hypothetical protein
MAKGDDFMKAWMQGFVERVTILINYFISTGVPQQQAADMAAQATQSDMDKAQKYVDQIGGIAKLDGMDFQTLAVASAVVQVRPCDRKSHRQDGHECQGQNPAHPGVRRPDESRYRASEGEGNRQYPNSQIAADACDSCVYNR